MISSTKNPRIVEARKLSQRKHRLRQNRFLVEGLQLLTMAMEMAALSAHHAKIKPLEVFYNETLFVGDIAPRLLPKLEAAGATLIPVTPNVLDTLSARDTSQGITATFTLNTLAWQLDELASHLQIAQSPNLLLILDQLQDPGNLGTLIRTADATNVGGVILLEPCVDPFDPKTIRGTMGSIFTVPFSRVQAIDTLQTQVTAWGYRLVGADGPRGVVPWQNERLAGPIALVLGNEARGLDDRWHHHLTDYVGLPLLGHAESLNVSIAGGVLMYEWLRINQPNHRSVGKA
ncbi:MAG: RNA methyltransferase [Chloroflexota bacterium]